jgi:hypothetical protein
MRATALTSILVLSLATAACGNTPAPEQAAAPAVTPASAPVANARQIMLGLVIPAADVVWSAANEAPADDAAWEKIQANAVMITEAGNMLQVAPRVVDQDEWLANAKALAETSSAAAQAAAEKNLDRLSDAGNNMYDVCDKCHAKYMPARIAEAAAAAAAK